MAATSVAKKVTTKRPTSQTSRKSITRRQAIPIKTTIPAVPKPKLAVAPTPLVQYSAVQAGDIMAIVTFVKVTAKGGKSFFDRDDTLQVQNLDNGMDFQVQGTPLVEQMFSADRFLKTEELSKTELAKKLITLHNRPFTVTFETQDKTERKIRARYIGHEELLGRSQVTDLDAEKGDNFRLVDHRTLREIIVDGVQYKLKKK